MFPLAILRDRRIHGDPVLQLEAAVRNYGLQELPNLFCGGNLVCDRHKSALSHQLSAISKSQKRASEQFPYQGIALAIPKIFKSQPPLLGGWIKLTADS
jgi:hypothetical protein